MRPSPRALALGCLGLAAAGCERPLQGPLAFPAVEQGARWDPLATAAGAPPSFLVVGLVDRPVPSWCRPGGPADAQAVALSLGGIARPVVPGTTLRLDTFLQPFEPTATLERLTTNDAGVLALVARATDGGVTLVRCDGARCTGSFEATMVQLGGSTSTLSGSFDAPVITCP